jgi:hypothetical protein
LYGYKNHSKTAQTAYLTKQAVLEKDCGEDGFYDNGDSLVENSKTLATRTLDTIERLMSEPCASKNGEGGIGTQIRKANFHRGSAPLASLRSCHPDDVGKSFSHTL